MNHLGQKALCMPELLEGVLRCLGPLDWLKCAAVCSWWSTAILGRDHARGDDRDGGLPSASTPAGETGAFKTAESATVMHAYEAVGSATETASDEAVRSATGPDAGDAARSASEAFVDVGVESATGEGADKAVGSATDTDADNAVGSAMISDIGKAVGSATKDAPTRLWIPRREQTPTKY